MNIAGHGDGAAFVRGIDDAVEGFGCVLAGGERAYVLEKRGWLLREKNGRFMPAPGAVGRGASPASAERLRPGAGTI
ncbi:hypothetical protein QFZ74_000634 [Streptomyces sp. V3I7]|nr:hypothetical protein [Streptomyces sp. V3I7]